MGLRGYDGMRTGGRETLGLSNYSRPTGGPRQYILVRIAGALTILVVPQMCNIKDMLFDREIMFTREMVCLSRNEQT